MPSNIESIRLPNLGWETAADVHFPPSFDEKKKYATVVTAHPIGSCKEQTSGNVYAKALAEEGFVAVAFDASFQGDSGGEHRFLEDPALRVSDFRFVVDYLQTLDYVDSDRIGVLGVCGGGGYALNAIQTDYRFKAAVGITPVNFGRLARESFAEYDPVGTLEKIGQQRAAEAQGAERNVVEFLPPTAEDAKKLTSDVDINEAVDYYKTDRGKKPHGYARSLFSFNGNLLSWDAFAYSESLLTKPFLVVVGDVPGGFGAYRDAQEIYGRAASKDKEILVLPKTTHYELYDQPKAVKPALEKVIPFLKKHLGETK